MTVELRQIIGDEPQQVILGHSGEEPQGTDQTVAWNGCEAIVRSNEVFTSREVAELFVSYYDTGDAPASCTRRRLDRAEGANAA
ncbi:MAG: hypothetical protein QOH12_1997 [Solirubrobacteraceae bacterium]|nr:hypothetical protein [Solirubrobacteraceae bacterium]